MKAFRESHIRGALSPNDYKTTGINDPHLFILWGEFRIATADASPSMQEA
ncbi:MAG: hypothetical protein M3360_06240 [Actinomycetota bacterium]|nr:hypothetical protein [Actinomycetota bacterium]